MTGSEADPDQGREGGRRARATIRTSHAAPATVAAALRPDNTDEMDTTVEGDPDHSRDDDPGDDTADRGRRVRTVIERDSAAGLRSTADDYLVNLDVADRTVRHANDHTTSP